MTTSNTQTVSLPGGGTAAHFDPSGATNLDRWRRFTVAAEAAHVHRPVLELRNVILCHGRDRSCLYDADGVRIDESALVRYGIDGEPEMWRAAPTLPTPRPAQTVDRPVVYSSIFFNHWGHFLLESLSRLSVAQAEPDLRRLPSVFSCMLAPAQRTPAITSIFDVVGVPVVESNDPIRILLRHCFIPSPGFGHEGFADPRHRTAPLAVARRLVGDAQGAAPPAYLSRSRVISAVPVRPATINEREFEARLGERGVEIVHMQELPLAEQVRVVNKRRAIIGLWGSALHNILFAQDGPGLSTFVLISPNQRPGNYLLVDSIVGNRAHYLATLRVHASGDLEIDIETTLAYLDNAGVFQ